MCVNIKRFLLLQLMWVIVGSTLKEFKKHVATAGNQTKSLQCIHLVQVTLRIKKPRFTSKRKI